MSDAHGLAVVLDPAVPESMWALLDNVVYPTAR